MNIETKNPDMPKQIGITEGQIKNHRQRLSRILNGILKIKSKPTLDISATHLQEALMAWGLVLKDIGAVDLTESDSKEYNFDAKTIVDKIKELITDIDREISEAKALYLSAAGTKLNNPNNAPFFPTHIITAIIDLEKSKTWLEFELKH